MYVVSRPFSAYGQPYTREKLRYLRGLQSSCRDGLKLPHFTMKINKKYIEMHEESMSNYLEETVVNSADWISWNLQLNIIDPMGKSFK